MILSDVLSSLKSCNSLLLANPLEEDFSIFLFEDEDSLEDAHVFNHFVTEKNSPNLAQIDSDISTGIKGYSDAHKDRFVLGHMLSSNPAFKEGLLSSVKEYAQSENKPSKFHVSVSTHLLRGKYGIKNKVFSHTIDLSDDAGQRLLDAHARGPSAVVAHFKDEFSASVKNERKHTNATGPMASRRAPIIAKAFLHGKDFEPALNAGGSEEKEARELAIMGDRPRKGRSEPADTGDSIVNVRDFYGSGNVGKRALPFRRGIGAGRTDRQYQAGLRIIGSPYDPKRHKEIVTRQKAIEAISLHRYIAQMHENPKLMEAGLHALKRHAVLSFATPEGARSIKRNIKETYGVDVKSPEQAYDTVHKHIMAYNPKKHFNSAQAGVIRDYFVKGKDQDGNPYSEEDLVSLISSGKIHVPHESTFKDPSLTARSIISSGQRSPVKADQAQKSFKDSMASALQTTDGIRDPKVRKDVIGAMRAEISDSIRLKRQQQAHKRQQQAHLKRLTQIRTALRGRNKEDRQYEF